MKQVQSGFTLIELVVVIVILGVLAATAVPKFIDLRSDANNAAFQGVRGGMESAMAVNYAGCAVVNNSATANKCVKVSGCADVASILQGGIPSGYSVAGSLSTTNGVSGSCTLMTTNFSSTGLTTFGGISAGN